MVGAAQKRGPCQQIYDSVWQTLFDKWLNRAISQAQWQISMLFVPNVSGSTNLFYWFPPILSRNYKLNPDTLQLHYPTIAATIVENKIPHINCLISHKQIRTIRAQNTPAKCTVKEGGGKQEAWSSLFPKTQNHDPKTPRAQDLATQLPNHK